MVSKNQIYIHATAGDYVTCTLTEDRKHVKAGTYRARVKTPTKAGVEVVINNHRIAIHQQYVKTIHRSDGYNYSFSSINADLLKLTTV